MRCLFCCKNKPIPSISTNCYHFYGDYFCFLRLASFLEDCKKLLYTDDIKYINISDDVYLPTQSRRKEEHSMTKLKVLKRERVNRALESIFEYPLTIMEAPIGYGKTTAVWEFLASKGVPVIWTSFLSEDNTAVAFWEKLAAEISRFDEEAGSRLKSLGVPSDTPQTTRAVSIINEMDYKPNTTLVIDDFHLAKSMKVTALFRRFVMEMPDDFHIVFITRDTSNLNIAELSAKGRCNLLPQQTLRFTDKEVRDYCAFMGFTISENELKKLCEYTGGWISLIYLIMLGTQRGIPMGYNSAIDSLIENVLYNAYDERIQNFLLRLSIMDSFTAEQALFVTQEPKSEEFLKKLRRENAFITLDEALGEYKIHYVLLDFLRAKQKDEKERASLYRLLGEWHLTRKEYQAAYGNLNRAHETERILEILDDPHNVTNYFAKFEGSFEMFAATPRALLHKYPLAYLQYIGLLLISGDAEAATDGAMRLDELQAVYERKENIPSERKNRVLAEVSGMRIFAVFNNAEKMVACTDAALALLDGSPSVLFKKENEFTFGSPHFLYSYYREPGRLKETVDLMAREFPGFSRLTSGLGTGCDYLTLAEYALETGDEAAAELNAFKAIYKAKTKDQTSIGICANFTLIRLYIYQGKINEALEQLSQLESDVSKENSAIYNTTLDLIKGYASACMGRSDGIPAWLSAGDMSPAHFMYQGLAFNYIVYGKAVLLSKNYIKLEMLTEEFTQYLSILHNQLGFLHNRILGAAAKYQLYGIEAGSAELQKAFDESREDHIVLPFAEYAPNILDMIRCIAYSDSRDTYIQDVLRSCERYMESLKSVSKIELSLSAREIEILSLAAEGLKRDEIAGRLTISTGTVRTHLQNIYQKLGVSGKIAAIKKAREQKLFYFQ